MATDGYPDETDLARIREWKGSGNGTDFSELLAFVKSIWWAADWGWHESDGKDDLDTAVRRYSISTGGWSGNEDIIGAMRDNWIFWSMCWHTARRGGHFIFQVRKRGA